MVKMLSSQTPTSEYIYFPCSKVRVVNCHILKYKMNSNNQLYSIYGKNDKCYNFPGTESKHWRAVLTPSPKLLQQGKQWQEAPLGPYPAHLFPPCRLPAPSAFPYPQCLCPSPPTHHLFSLLPPQHMEAQPLPYHAAVLVLMFGQAGSAAVLALLIGCAREGVSMCSLPKEKPQPQQSQAAPDSEGKERGWVGRQKLQKGSGEGARDCCGSHCFNPGS